jgi:hypothetical protein
VSPSSPPRRIRSRACIQKADFYISSVTVLCDTVYLGHPGVSRIERAYRQTSHMLLELGVLHGSAEAAFLEVPKCD